MSSLNMVLLFRLKVRIVRALIMQCVCSHYKAVVVIQITCADSNYMRCKRPEFAVAELSEQLREVIV